MLTVVQSMNGNGGALTQTVSIIVASGESLSDNWYYDDGGNGGTVTLITDTGLNTHTMGASAADAGSSHQVGTANALNIANPVTAVTAHVTGSTLGNFIGLTIWDISATGTVSLGSTAALDTPSSTTGTDATKTGALAISTTDAVIVGIAYDLSSNSIAVGTGFTADATGQNGSPGEHKFISGSAANGCTWTASSAGSHEMASGSAIQESTGGGGVVDEDGDYFQFLQAA